MSQFYHTLIGLVLTLIFCQIFTAMYLTKYKRNKKKIAMWSWHRFLSLGIMMLVIKVHYMGYLGFISSCLVLALAQTFMPLLRVKLKRQ